MARGINKVILVGTLGSDPDIKNTTAGSSIANISLATNESWRDKNTGQIQEKTEWHRVVIFGKLAEIAGQYLRKGSQVYFEGKLQTRKWQDQNGHDKYTTEVVVDFGGQMQMLVGTNNQSNQSYSPTKSMNNINHSDEWQNSQGQVNNSSDNKSITPPPTPDFDFDDDIPFEEYQRPV